MGSDDKYARRVRAMKATIILLAMLFTVSASALGDVGPGGHMGYGDHMMGYGGGIFMWLLFLAVVAIVAYVVVQTVKQKGDHGHINETAADILKKRYARGEITREEFEEKMKHIGS
jgi:putative membrane protein